MAYSISTKTQLENLILAGAHVPLTLPGVASHRVDPSLYLNTTYPTYSQLVSGGMVSINQADSTLLNIGGGTVILFTVDSAGSLNWEFKDFLPQSLSYDVALTAPWTKFLSLTLPNLSVSWSAGNATVADVEVKIQLSEVRGDGTNFTRVIPCYRDNRPSIQSELAIASGLLNREGVKLTKPDTNVPQFKLEGGSVLATGYSPSGNIEIPSKEIVEFSLMFSDGTIYAANETNWDFALYEASTAAASFNNGNDASIFTVFIHPVTEEVIVLLWQFQGRLLGNSNVGLRYLPSYTPIIPDKLRNGSFIQLGSVVAEGDDTHSNRNTVQFVPLVNGGSAGQITTYPLVQSDTLPNPADNDVLGCILTGQGWRNGYYYRDPDRNKYIRTISSWRIIKATTPIGDRTLVEGDYVAIDSTAMAVTANIAATLSLGDIKTSAEIKVKTDSGVTSNAMIRLNDPINTAITYQDGTGAVQSATMPFEINEGNETFVLFLLEGVWNITRN